jgi:integrase
MPKLSNAAVGGEHGVSRRFTDLMKSAGIDTRSVKGAGKRNLARKSFHALRHSFTSALANAGVAPELRMKMTGHASAAAHAGYTHHELETLKAAVEKLPGL